MECYTVCEADLKEEVSRTRNASTIYRTKPQNNPFEGDQKGGEELLPERTSLFGFRIGVDRYGWGEWEGEVPDLCEKMRRMGFLDMYRVPK